jgi:hypothetical protein
MPRTVDIALTPAQSDRLLARVRMLDGLVGIRLQRGVSIQPPGDILSVDVTNRGLFELAHLLDAEGIGRTASTSWSSSEPLALVSQPSIEKVTRDISEATWEEVESRLAKESNSTISGLLLMALSGAIATAGLSTNALHLVIGAMVIAPAFEPITRIGLGLVSPGAWRRGLLDFVKGYLALLVGAGLMAVLLRLVGYPETGQSPAYLPTNALVAYWLDLSAASVLVSSAGALAGALLIAANRTVLTAGVMIALALVPSAALIAIGVVEARGDLLLGGLVRWAVDVALVLVLSTLVFATKQAASHRRRSAF